MKAKLKPAQERELRRRFTAGEATTELAQEFGISRSAVYRITGGGPFERQKPQGLTR